MRYARYEDLSRIVEIYNEAVPTRLATADTEKVSLESKKQWFENHTREKHPTMVYEDEGQVLGWVSFEPFYGRPAYAQTAEISIYLAQDCCSKGLGSKLLGEAIKLAPDLKIKSLVGYIFSHNKPSLGLFRKFGFEEWGKLPDIAVMDGQKFSLSILGLHLNQ